MTEQTSAKTAANDQPSSKLREMTRFFTNKITDKVRLGIVLSFAFLTTVFLTSVVLTSIIGFMIRDKLKAVGGQIASRALFREFLPPLFALLGSSIALLVLSFWWYRKDKTKLVKELTEVDKQNAVTGEDKREIV